MSKDGDPERVLVVDDEDRVAETYQLRLATEYEVDVATGGEEALDVVDEGYDVVLLDRRMPDVSGDEVLAEMRNRDIDSQVVMVTAVDPDVDIIDLECTDYLVKPVETAELREAVERALKLSTYSDRRRELGTKKLKRNVLEVENDERDLADDEEYQRLQREIDRLERQIDDLEEELGLEGVDQFL